MPPTELTRWLISTIVPAASAIVGVLVGAGLTGWREQRARRHAFLQQQLDEFYSPMLGIRQEILAKSQLRLEISQVADVTWRELCVGKNPEELGRLSQETGPAFEKMIKYDNRQLTEELLPAYRKLLELFREKMWFANQSTRRHYDELVKFVGIWDRWLDRSLPREVLVKLGHTEERLKPLYEDLERNVALLRTQVAGE